MKLSGNMSIGLFKLQKHILISLKLVRHFFFKLKKSLRMSPKNTLFTLLIRDLEYFLCALKVVKYNYVTENFLRSFKKPTPYRISRKIQQKKFLRRKTSKYNNNFLEIRSSRFAIS